MGIYINMERPKDCWHCRFADPEEGGCLVDQKTHGDWDEPDECPIIPIPNGRLIDAGELRNVMFIGEQCLYSWDEIEDAIDYAPTVIPAESDKN